MRLLLDTHVALWWLNDPAALSDEARELVAEARNDVFLSSISLWEAAVKAEAGRLDVPSPTQEAAGDAGFLELPVRWNHALRAAVLPPLHRDPFDRMLVAQALAEELVLVTRDQAVRQYPVATLEA